MKTTAKLSKLEREGILTNAEMRSCIAYWVEEFIKIQYSPIEKPNYRLVELVVRLGEDAPEGFTNKTVTIDHKTIQKGVDTIMAHEDYDHIKTAIIENDHDVETTDVIIQFGLFGKLVYA